ncbi:ABC transporter substrate-binding protein [Solicola gregarius]|uniref:ABC transporter substrate-binding protein n=1 Tax=Solicola gregarius TaxID=2908642 RepID=A0AA46TKK3_9ACTN|nr:ABC transporter substrate-binding protein [Solicola gregarius]UYM06996.1 ABC transporter substrate-binding protein [Solicola gregarius]
MKLRRALATSVGAAVLLSVAACGGDDDPLAEDDGDSGSSDKGSLVVSGQDFTEGQIMAEMYDQVLSASGYDVEQKLVDTRDIYFAQLRKGSVDVVPDYLAGIGDYLNIEANGPDAKAITSNSPDESLDAISPLAEDAGISLLEPAEATNQNGYAVSEDFASDNDLKTLSDLGKLGESITLAAAPDCEDRTDCAKGLKEVYKIDIEKVLPLGFGGAPTRNSVEDGESQLGQFGTTDPTVEEAGLVFLEDDKGLQPAQNLTPAVNTDFLKDHPDVADTLNELSAGLTTDQLMDLNNQVDSERVAVPDAVEQYLTDEGLL